MTNPSTEKTQPWALSYEAVSDQFEVQFDRGLDQAAVKARRQKHGRNRLKEQQSRGVWDILIDQFESVVVLLLAASAVIALAFGRVIDSIAIGLVIVVNAGIGFVTEWRAVQSMEALRELGHVTTKVRREGKIIEIAADELVPGDIVVLEGGDIITADLRLTEAAKLQVNESPLTGESVPVAKQVEPLDADTPLAERANMVFKGTSVTRGTGEGIVVATGMDTELGQISALVDEAQDEDTPLEQRLDAMARKLVWITIAVAAVVAVLGIVRGKELALMVETSIALAVAAIPEGLPIVATIALARGMNRMAKRHALVNRLAAVETLGGTNVICTDKTGTLTENQMTVTNFCLTTGGYTLSGEGLETKGTFSQNDAAINPDEHPVLRRAVEVGVLCNNAALPNGEDGDAVGDPMEVALLVAGAKAGFRRADLLETLPEEREDAFDSDTKMMATFHQRNGRYRVAVKGAPDAVVDVCTHLATADGEADSLTDEQRSRWLDENHRMAEEGLRVLAVAEREADSPDEKPYQNLTLLGLVGMIDPPREAVKEAIQSCQRAGVRIVMVTGDQPVTARNVGLAVGLIDSPDADVINGGEVSDLTAERERVQKAPILARVSPAQKLDLIDIHQAHGDVVAMTGDGVNDAPALKKADIGVAMGQRGTQVAQEAADMVLQNDAFGSIVAAIEQGRIIFSNIRKFVVYLHSNNSAKIILIGTASALGTPLPILPLQILYLNVITDVFPALALGVGPGSEKVMDQPPRPGDEPILTRQHWLTIAGYGTLLMLTVLSSLWLAINWLGFEPEAAVSVSFLTLGFGQMWHVFNMRGLNSNLISNEITRNPWVWGALALCTGLLLAATYVPGLSDVLRVSNPGLEGWLLIAGMSLIPVTVGQILKLFGLGKLS